MWIPEAEPCHTDGTKLAKVVRMDNISETWAKAVEAMGDADLLEDCQMNRYDEQKFLWHSFVDWCEDLVKQRARFDWIKNEGFDLVFTDDPHLCSVGLVHYLGIPRHIWIASGPLHEINSRLMGVPPMLSYVPVLESDNLIGPIMSFTDRLWNMYAYGIGTAIQWSLISRITAVYRKHISPDFPDVAELTSKAALCFVNSDEFIDIARPVLHKTLYVGGIGIKEPRPLPE
ncbi:CRE-UGT-49 protein, partial [Aphelenchoides avenae]